MMSGGSMRDNIEQMIKGREATDKKDKESRDNLLSLLSLLI